LGLIDYWAVGYINEGVFKTTTFETRSLKRPDLMGVLKIYPAEGKTIGMHVVNVYGKQEFYMINQHLTCERVDCTIA